MSTSCRWEGKGRYGSFRLRIEFERVGVQVKRRSVKIRAIIERFWGDDFIFDLFMKRRYRPISSVDVRTFTFTGNDAPTAVDDNAVVRGRRRRAFTRDIMVTHRN